MVEETLASNNPGLAAGSVGQFIKRAVSVAVQIGNAMVIQEGIRRSRGGSWKKKYNRIETIKKVIRSKEKKNDDETAMKSVMLSSRMTNKTRTHDEFMADQIKFE